MPKEEFPKKPNLESGANQSAGESNGRYKHFPKEFERKHLFEAFKKIGDYIHDNKIENIVFIDRSSRGGYMGVKEYLKLAYPKEKQPEIYFVNPRGFKLKNFDNSPASLKPPLPMTDEERHQKIDEHFSQIYKKLCEGKDKPTMIFDSCIHKGGTMIPLVDSFKRQGFKNVKVCVYNEERMNYPKNIPIDFIVTENPMPSCSPFGVEDVLRANIDVVSSVRPYADKSMYEKVSQLRSEMMQIVRDGLENEKNNTSDPTRNRTAI